MFYIFIFILSIGIFLLFRQFGKPKLGLGFMLLLLCAVAGCRDMGVGTDTAIYSQLYYYLAKQYNVVDCFLRRDVFDYHSRAYFLLNKFSLMFGAELAFPFFFTEVCILGGAFYFFYKFKKDFKFSFILLIFLYLFTYYNQTYNYMRQLCGVSFTFGAYYYFLKKKYIACVIALVIGYAFHTSAICGILPIAIHVLCNIKSSKKRKILIIAYVSVLLVSGVSFNLFLTFFASNGLILEEYGDRYGTASMYQGGFTTSQIIGLLFLFFIIFVSWRKKILPINQLMEMMLLHTTASVLSLCSIYVIFLYRLSFFVSYPELLFVAVVLSSPKQNKVIKYVYIAWTIIIWARVYIVQNSCETYPYTSRILFF